MVAKILVPNFDMHQGTVAWLTKSSWREIFEFAPSEQAPTPRNFYRKVVKVRLPKQYGFMVPMNLVRGFYTQPGLPYRKVYGEVLFHTRHDLDGRVPYQTLSQLQTFATSQQHTGHVTSVLVYLTEHSRFTEKFYRPLPKCNITFREVAEAAVTDDDYEYGLLKTRKMLEWNYCPPPTNEKPWTGWLDHDEAARVKAITSRGPCWA